jgi:hypothetical protein
MMSYIPKYILKRMVPADAFKIVSGGLEITAINVISPLSVDSIPDGINIEEYIDFSIDGTKIPNADKPKCSLSIGEGSDVKTFFVTNQSIKGFEGMVIPVGGKMKIFLPVTNVKSGEEHEFEILIKTDNPFNIKVTRTIQ